MRIYFGILLDVFCLSWLCFTHSVAKLVYFTLARQHPQFRFQHPLACPTNIPSMTNLSWVKKYSSSGLVDGVEQMMLQIGMQLNFCKKSKEVAGAWGARGVAPLPPSMVEEVMIQIGVQLRGGWGGRQPLP